MRRGTIAVLVALVAGTLSCRRATEALPPGAALGPYTDVGEPEGYSATTLYSYMDGGADLYREYGMGALAVRRYARGGRTLVVELFEMKDDASAAALLSHVRRAGTEGELFAGCVANVTPSEVVVARGPRLAVCRPEEPMAEDAPALKELCARVLGRLSGTCGCAQLFHALPIEGRHVGSEVALVGPVGLNRRPWFGAAGREGFARGWLATYDLRAGSVEVLRAEYATPAQGEQSAQAMRQSEGRDLRAWTAGARVVFVHGAAAADASAEALARRMLAAPL